MGERASSSGEEYGDAAHARHSLAAQHTRDEQRPVVLNQPESDEAWRS